MKTKSLLLLLMLAFGLPWTARAQQTPKTLPYEYGFENNDLAAEGWTMQLCNANSGINTTAKHSGSYGFRFYYNTNPPQYLISPELTGCPYGVEMELYYKASYCQQNETFQLGYSMSTNSIEAFDFGETIEPSTTNWTSLSESFPAGTKYIAIKYTANNQYYLFFDDIVFTALPSCPTPKDLSAALTEGAGTIAALSWTEKGSATNWVLQCGTDENFSAGSFTEYAVTGTPVNNLTGLTPETPYYARVKSDCGGGDQSEWSAVCSFTPSNAITMIVNDGTASNYNVPVCIPYGDGSQFIIPASGLSPVAYGQITKVSFYAASTSVFPWGTATYDVYLTETPESYFTGNVGFPYSSMTKVYTGTLSVDDGLMTISFNTPYYYEGDNLLIAVNDDNSSMTSSYFYWFGINTTNNQALSGMAGNQLEKFLPKTKIAYLVGETPSHPRPKYFKTTNITSNSATFTWTNGGTETVWQIAYIDDENVAPDDIPSANIVDVTTNPYTLSGLTGGTEYYAYIRAVAGSEHSDWSNACVFTPDCNSPYNFGPNYVTVNSARLTWTNGGTESEWQIVYAAEDENFDPELATPIDVTTKPYTLTGLSTDVDYYARIRAKCAVGDYSDWSDVAQFTPTCIDPYNLNATLQGPTSVKLNWLPGGNQSGWQIAYTDNATTLPDDATIVNVGAYPPYTLSGLTPDMTYYAYVRSDCGTEHYSDWSTVCSFTPTYLLTVNDGTSTNAYVPVRGLYVDDYSKSQFIIPASSLESIAYATIDKLVFYCSNTTNVDWGVAEFDVCMKETTQTDFAVATLDWTDMETVYSGSLSVANGVMEIQFAEGFSYQDGNLLIGIKETKTGTARSSYWYGINTNSNTAVGGYETTRGLSLYQFLPKTSLYYTPGAAPTCIKPTGLSINESSNSATLTWTAGAEEIHWNVQYKATSATDWNTIIAVENTPECLISGLDPATSYQVRVQADCGSGDVSGWLTGSFTTICGAFNLPYEHDFDGDTPGATAGLPDCWSRINDSETTTYQNYPRVLADETGQMHSYSSPNYLLFYRLGDYTALNQIAVFPEMDAPVNTLILTFYAKLNDGNTNQKLAVGVMSDPDDAATFEKYQDVTIASSTYAEYTVNFDEYEGLGTYIAIKCERGSQTRYFIDDISISVDQTCHVPVTPQISNITTHAANFTWTPGSDVTNWQVQYKKTSDTNWSESVAVSGTPSYTLSNLNAATTYQVRVRTNCGDDNYSDWVETENFITDCGFVTLPYSHNFENDATGHVAPACWYFSDGTYPSVYEANSMAHLSSKFLRMQKPSNESACYAVLPSINTTENSINTLKLSFWARMWEEPSLPMYLSVGVMTDPDDINTYQFITSVSVRSSYALYEVYFDDYAGEGQYIVLRCYNNSNYFCVDDIEISVAPTCRQPLDLSTQYTHAHEAEIRWMTRDLRQRNYQVSYSTDETFNPENGTIVDVEFENTLVNAGTDYRYYYLTCLNAHTTYYYYVRANCGNGDFSEWSDDYASLTTGEACLGPDNVTITEKNTYVKFEWNGEMDTEWEFQYKELSSGEWITPADFAVTPGYELYLTYTLHGLTPGTNYNARLRKHCGTYSCPEVDDGYSNWLEINFTTNDGCWDGDPWMCTSHLGTQATVRWLNDAPDMRWQIRYRLSTEYDYPEGNIVTTDTLPEAFLQQYTLTGLETNSTYYWQVRGYCGEAEQSDWSDEDYFFTRSTDGYITVDKAHPYYEDFEDGIPENWSRMNLCNYDMDHYDAWEWVNASSNAGESFPPSMCISSCRENMSWASDGSMILMPAIHIDSTATSAWLSFWSKDAFNANDARGTKMIWVNDNYLSTEYTAFDLGGIYQKSSKAGYWRKCFVNLDDYIGQTIIIAFDYIVTHNYNNYDWWVDNVSVEVFDNVFGGGSGVTEGSWDDPNMWGGNNNRSGNLPMANDNVLVSAKVTIPKNFIAEANRIVLNLDTVAGVKYGNVIIADGGQLKVNEEVEATMQKSIAGYGRGGSNWYLIAPPIKETLDPESDSVTNIIEGAYDLYAFDGSYEGAEWRNYKKHQSEFVFQNGHGYLVANSITVSPSFKGTVLPSNQTKTVELDCTNTVLGGWNLVGNPFTCDAYLADGRSFLRMNGDGSELVSATGLIHPMEGVFVEADGLEQSVTFTTTNPSRGRSMEFALSQNRSSVINNAVLRFDNSHPLGKLLFNETDSKLYFPQDGKDYAALNAEPADVMPLHFEPMEDGTYTINVSTDNLDVNYLHLIDNLTGNDVDLLQKPSYTFEAHRSDYASRFKVVFATGDMGHGDDFAFIDGNGEIRLLVETCHGASLQIIDALGHILIERRDGVHTVSTANMTPGVYVLRLIDGEKVKTQKIVVK